MSLPTLYSLQHCPYAMRARLALLMAKQDVLIRAVVTKNKPTEMLKISPKGTVPILILLNDNIIDESLEIMIWALNKNDPSNLLYTDQPTICPLMLKMIKVFDTQMKPTLSAYKHAKRFHLETEIELREACEVYINQLEILLMKNDYLFGNKLSLADLAILPFIRQFVNVDKKWFRQARYTQLGLWLENLLQSLLFTKAMKKYPLWLESQDEFILSWDKV